MIKRATALVLFLAALTPVLGQNQTISSHLVVDKDSTWEVAAGSIIEFKSGASVEVLGGLSFVGEAQNPIVLKGIEPGAIGLLVNGQSSGEITLKYVRFETLEVPLRFDPYWYRTRTQFSWVTFVQNGSTNSADIQPIVAISEPLIRLDRPAELALHQLYFANNSGGMFVDGLGRNGWSIEGSHWVFEFNEVGSGSISPLHLEFVGPTKNYNLDKLLFNQNMDLGLLLTGYDKPVQLGQILINAQDRTPIISKRSNYRLPELTANVDTLSTVFEDFMWSGVLDVIHEVGEVSLHLADNANVSDVQLLSEQRSVINSNIRNEQNHVFMAYDSGFLPTLAVLNSGVELALPELDTAALSLLRYAFEESLEEGNGGSTPFSIAKKALRTIAHPKPVAGFTPSWQLGAAAGFTMYDGRDLKMIPFSTTDAFSILPNIGMKWPGGQIGYTGGIQAQYNRNAWFSQSLELNRLNVNGGKARTFPYRFTAAPIRVSTIDDRGNRRSYSLPFTTAITSAEVMTYRHLRSNYLPEGKKAKVVPSVGLGLGLMHYNPQRTFNVATTSDPYRWYLTNTRSENFPLRRAGTAGQNNIDGMSRYNRFAGLASTSFALSRMTHRGALKAELKGVISGTDYLDDFGRGTFYGGDYTSWSENAPTYSYINPVTDQEVVIGPTSLSRADSRGGSRAQNYMTDGYWELKFSYQVFLDQSKVEPIVSPAMNFLDQNAAKLTETWEKKRGLTLDSSWEFGIYSGVSWYDGRDLKYRKLGIIPVPTNLEYSGGFYAQKNAYDRFSWNVGMQWANMSYYRRSSAFYIVSGQPLEQYDRNLDSTFLFSSYVANFLTRTASLESNILYHFTDYRLSEGQKWKLVPSFGLGLGLMQFTPYREVQGLDRIPPRFLEWQPRSTAYIDLRGIGSEGQNILPNGRPYGKWAGTYSTSLQLSLLTKKWIYKIEAAGTMTTTDYLDDFGRGAWYGGNYTLWGDAISASYIDDATGQTVDLAPSQISNPSADMNLFLPRARNNWADGFWQINFGIARQL